MDHIHLVSDPRDPNRDVQVRCNAQVCYAMAAQRDRQAQGMSPFVRRALARELPAKIMR